MITDRMIAARTIGRKNMKFGFMLSPMKKGGKLSAAETADNMCLLSVEVFSDFDCDLMSHPQSEQHLNVPGELPDHKKERARKHHDGQAEINQNHDDV